MSTTSKANKKTRNAIIGLIVVVALVVVSLIVGQVAFGHKNETPKGNTVIKVGVTSEADSSIWDAVNDVLKKQGKPITIKLVKFQGGTTQNADALTSGDIDLSASAHYAFWKNLVDNKGYKITNLGDTIINAYNLYSLKHKDVSSIPDGGRIAVPNNATNAARAYNVLQQAGLIKLNPANESLPTKQDITENPKNLIIDEVDPNQIPNLLQDYDAGVTNVFSVIDHGMKPDENAIYKANLDLNDPFNHQWINTIACATKNKDNPLYKDVVDAYHTKEVAETIIKDFKGAYTPAFKY